MLELILFVIFVISLGGILFILARKIPDVILLPQNGDTGIKNHKVVAGASNKVKSFFIFFEKQIFLHKLLSWIKVITLKIETRVDILLHRIRKKAQETDKKIKDKK